MILPPDNTLLSISWPKRFVPRGKPALGGLGFGGGLTNFSVGSYGEIQGPSTVIRIIDDTIIDPIIVIHPAEPLLVNEVNPGMKRARIVRLIFSLGNLFLLESYPRVKVRVQDIYGEVYRSNDEGKIDYSSLNGGVVPEINSIDQISS